MARSMSILMRAWNVSGCEARAEQASRAVIASTSRSRTDGCGIVMGTHSRAPAMRTCRNLWMGGDMEMNVARVQGIDPKKTSWLMQLVFRQVRKVFGKDLTPQKIQARVPRVFWATVIAELLLGERAGVSRRLRSIVQ